jgi:hypothetical protein
MNYLIRLLDLSWRVEKVKLLKNGRSISAISVENITPFGVWLYVSGREYFLDYDRYPYFKDKSIKDIHNVKLLHGFHLHWPSLDVDLEIDNLEHPEKYPLRSKLNK